MVDFCGDPDAQGCHNIYSHSPLRIQMGSLRTALVFISHDFWLANRMTKGEEGKRRGDDEGKGSMQMSC